MELGLDAAISYPIHFQLEAQPGTIHDHLQREIQVIEFDAPCRRQPCKQAPWHRAQIRRQGADIGELAVVRRRWIVGLAGD